MTPKLPILQTTGTAFIMGGEGDNCQVEADNGRILFFFVVKVQQKYNQYIVILCNQFFYFFLKIFENLDNFFK